MDGRIELLAPAKDGPTARAALLCGADAVYLGAARFGAREAAGNSLDTIREVVEFAHPYYARVYVTLNTLLYDRELPVAEKMIRQFYEMGVDALIVQDVGLLELDLPPLPLIASTQMDNATVEKVKFWEEVGFWRVILARELTLEQIRRIRSQTRIDLECFVHGALCVGASGQCYLSYALGGRSGNRGQCAQPCRRLYCLKDRRGRQIGKDRHLLSLKDLNLAEHLEELIDAGITSFKIEGRLKDTAYVANTVGFYRQTLDAILSRENGGQTPVQRVCSDAVRRSCRGHPARAESKASHLRPADGTSATPLICSYEHTTNQGLRRSSSGSVRLRFEPNLEKTFNRGFTDYGLTGMPASITALDTPKSIGEYVGKVTRVDASSFVLNGVQDLHNADGLCFFDRQRNLDGTVVNRVEGRRIYPQKMQGIYLGQEIYRNFDYAFSRQLAGRMAERKVRVTMLLEESAEGLVLSGTDEDGNQAKVEIAGDKQPAETEEAARQTIRTQLTRLGNTIFECTDLQLRTEDTYFLPVSRLNAAKRELIEQLEQIRQTNRPRLPGGVRQNAVPYPEKHLTYLGNALNEKARAFYRRHGVESIAPAAESGPDLSGAVVMTTKYCLRRELGLCQRNGAGQAEPLILEDEDGRSFELRFRCGPCGMEILLERQAE
ncbi:MAG: U32 family peptidase [Planctomycetes bacterium]|nr:U32 family peptidase [Planctomycetota bacterium]